MRLIGSDIFRLRIIRCAPSGRCAAGGYFYFVVAISLACLISGALSGCNRAGSRGKSGAKEAGGNRETGVSGVHVDGGSPHHDVNAENALNALIREQLDAELQFSPTLATWLGDHASDDRLDDVHIETIGREIARTDNILERARHLSEQAEELSDAQRLDLQLLLGRLEARHLDLSEIRPYEKNPLYYLNVIAYGLDNLVGPNLMSMSGMRALRGRLAAVPSVCREAQRSLKNPPELWTRRAVEVAQMTRDFVALLLPRVLANVTLPDPAWPALLDDVNLQREVAQHALDDLIAWLGHDLQPRSKGDWSLSRERFAARLRSLELLDVPLDTLQNLLEFEHRETRRRLDDLTRRLTAQSNATRATADLLRSIEEDHPRPEELLHAAETAMDKAFELTIAQQFVTPPATRPQVAELPAYRYGYILLSMPALLEPDRQAQLYIDPVDQSWKDRKHVSDHLRLLNRTQLLLSALHEVVPGHFTQQMALRRQASGLSPIRLRTLSTAFLEGWSHYAEQAMVPDGNAKFLALRLQLLRLGRMLAALRLHAPPPGSATPAARLEDAVRFFAEECYLEEYAARREAERLTYDPLSGLGALGDLQLLQLRADYQAEKGASFSAQAFHDALLAQGALPVVALRHILLSRPGPSLLLPPEPPPSPLSDTPPADGTE